MVDLPKAGTQSPAPQKQEDWRTALVQKATAAGSRLATKERAHNPMIPDNFLDLSDAGFPADLVVLPIQRPRDHVPAEMSQYRDLLNRQWQHVPWSVISSNGGQDGKANVPGAVKHDLGSGEFVAMLAGHFLMFANRQQFEARRKTNERRSAEHLQYKMESHEEDVSEQYGRTKAKLRVDATNTGPMTVEQLFEYEKSIGDEASIKGARIDR